MRDSCPLCDGIPAAAVTEADVVMQDAVMKANVVMKDASQSSAEQGDDCLSQHVELAWLGQESQELSEVKSVDRKNGTSAVIDRQYTETYNTLTHTTHIHKIETYTSIGGH